ncbi:DnaJ domain-containing protein [Desulfonatronovibrio hydrogenovorans]|uniref:DnaJ domain-containing protein n=1 Tax=Desulfonatronovibrio hydrogenovorans TaxID=53245 RepID=UPI00048FD5DF|nr:DnaJ domain-containing protein [Desulfonatronovibrio hydrogenovorans]
MNIRECFDILGVSPDSDLDAVKKAYRELAFKYHPDLNPDDPQAGSKFHRINTAYVALRKDLADNDSSDRAGTGAFARKAASKTYQQQAYQARKKETFKPGTDSDQGDRRRKFFYRQEEVLKDILNDPFAKQVFEDIFKKIKRTGKETSPSVVKTRRLKLEWGRHKLDIDLSRGLLHGVKRWFSSQLDDEQTVYLSPLKLRPGSSIRINVQRKWSGPAQSINITLPEDYVVGRPVRLRGLGRKIGPWKGDLYLRLLAK